MPVESDAEVEEIRKVQGSDGSKRPPADGDAQGNWDTLSGFTYQTGTNDPESLDSYAIPDGGAVFVHPLSSNNDPVKVGPQGAVTYPLSDAGNYYTAQVTDTAEIYVDAITSGDGVAVHWEADS